MKTLSYFFNQSIAILQPKEIGSGRCKVTEITYANYFKLLNFQFAMDECTIEVSTKSVKTSESRWFDKKRESISFPVIKPEFYIDIKGPQFFYSFKAMYILEIWKRIKTLLPKNDAEIMQHSDGQTWKDVVYLSGNDFNHLKTAAKFTANDELRPVMNCILIGKDIVASDAHKLICYPFDFDGSILINKIGQKFLRSCKKDVMIQENESKIKLESAGKFVIIDKTDGNYPDYKAVMPKEFKYYVRLNRESLIQAVNQVSPYTNQSSNLIRFNLKDNRLNVIGQDIDFATSSIKELNVETNCSGQIGFKSEFLLECLKANQTKVDDTIELQFNVSNRATMIDGILLMPMMIDGKDEDFLTYKTEVKRLNYYPGLFGNNRYNRSNIMKNAWLILRDNPNVSYSLCLKLAWRKAKDERPGYYKTVNMDKFAKAA
jgi:hypothetical protein